MPATRSLRQVAGMARTVDFTQNLPPVMRQRTEATNTDACVTWFSTDHTSTSSRHRTAIRSPRLRQENAFPSGMDPRQ
jgi:hypothetical protein